MGMLLQIPVFFGLYAVISNIANPQGVTALMKFPVDTIDMVYSFFYPYVYTVLDIANLTTHFFGMNVLEKNNLILAAIGGLLMFVNMSLMSWTRPATPKIPGGAAVPDMAKMMSFMNYFLVFMIATFVYSVANGIGMYIITSTLFGVVQLYLQNRILINAKLATLMKKK